jgi:uncharacterized protein YrrD
MEKIMLFQKDAEVIDANGQQVGSLERVVLNPDTKLVTDVVVRTGTLFNKEDKVVPVEYIVETAENQIVLSRAAGELTSFPPFEERHLVDADDDIDQKSVSDVPQVIYGSPGFGPMVVPAPGQEFTTQIEQNIPNGTVAVKEGAKVITADGKHIGNLERVLTDASVDQVTNLEISKGLFTKERRLIPMKWVMSMGEDEVRLRVNEESIDDE